MRDIDWTGIGMALLGGWQAYKEWRLRREKAEAKRMAERTAADLQRIHDDANREREEARKQQRCAYHFPATGTSPGWACGLLWGHEGMHRP